MYGHWIGFTDIPSYVWLAQNRAMQVEARVSRGLKDELDCLRERAARVEQLQAELKNCTHRLRSMELYRTQLKVEEEIYIRLNHHALQLGMTKWSAIIWKWSNISCYLYSGR